MYGTDTEMDFIKEKSTVTTGAMIGRVWERVTSFYQGQQHELKIKGEEWLPFSHGMGMGRTMKNPQTKENVRLLFPLGRCGSSSLYDLVWTGCCDRDMKSQVPRQNSRLGAVKSQYSGFGTPKTVRRLWGLAFQSNECIKGSGLWAHWDIFVSMISHHLANKNCLIIDPAYQHFWYKNSVQDKLFPSLNLITPFLSQKILIDIAQKEQYYLFRNSSSWWKVLLFSPDYPHLKTNFFLHPFNHPCSSPLSHCPLFKETSYNYNQWCTFYGKGEWVMALTTDKTLKFPLYFLPDSSIAHHHG